MSDYLPRTLTWRSQAGNLEKISDRDLVGWMEPMIVLGEPGMGKTRLLEWIAGQPGWALRPAAIFAAHPEPAILAQRGTRLVIDGLDELPAGNESDPVYRILGQLVRAGRPLFVLSCRAADWRGAIAKHDIAVEYGLAPRELTLEPFSRDDAIRFLSSKTGSRRAETIIRYLDEKEVSELYGNPLTLTLFAEIAKDNRPLPRTRSDLMQRACDIMWSERNDRHDNSALSRLDKDSALAAAGAVSAALVLTAR